MIFANDLPFSDGEENPLRALESCLAFAADDWAATRAMAWAWGIIEGWDEASLIELAPRFRWDEQTVARLRRLHAVWMTLSPSDALVGDPGEQR